MENIRKRYSLETLRGDLLGGLVAGIVALPLALAFGVQSGLGAEAGLYGAIAGGILAALLGGTATQVTGPTGPMTVVSASVIAIAIERTGAVESGLGIILLTFFLAGAFQVLFGLIGIARYVRYFPYPVISGFMSGVGLIIVFLQIWPFLGSESPKTIIEVFTRFGDALANLNWASIGLGALTVAIFYLFPRITKAIPSTLVALVVGTLAAVLIGVNVPVIGDIPAGLPSINFGTLFSVDAADYLIILEFALILAMLGSIDSLLTSVIADNITKTKHDSNRELIGQGVGNMAAALIGGIPGAGATKGTVVNINAGGRTRLSGVLHGILLLIVLLGLGRYAALVPLSVLAGILIPIGLAIVDYKGIKDLRYVPLADGAVLVAVLLVTLFGSLIQAVGVGVVLASVLYMKQSSDLAEARTSVNPISTVDGHRLTEEGTNTQILEEGVFVKYLYGPMFFGFTARFQELIKEVSGKLKVLILCMDRVPYIDQSGLYAIEDAVLDLEREGAVVIFTGVDTQPMDMMRRIDIIPDLVPEEHIFSSFDDALAWVRDYLNGDSISWDENIEPVIELA